MTSSSVEPVGAPTTVSFVRTIVTPRSRSLCSSEGERRHSVIRVVISVLELAGALVSVEVVAPVVLVEALVAPIVLEVLCSDVLAVEELGVVLEVELGEVVLSVEAERDTSVVVDVSVDVELGKVLAVLLGLEVLVSVEVVELGVVELVELGDVGSVELVELGLVELDVPYVEPVVPVELELELEVGPVDDVVFKLPLVFSFVVLGLEVAPVVP
jgi:hypothetical protein